MTTAAAIDIGTNSVRLLVVDEAGDTLERRMNITRLGQGVDEHSALQQEAIDRTLEVLEEYATLLSTHACKRLRMTATSAARDARNRTAFFEQVRDRVGQVPELLSGAEEAQLSFRGAIADVPRLAGPALVFDIGGGSTEFALGSSEPDQFISLDVGAVRMTERFLLDDPPTPRQWASARTYVQEQLERVADQLEIERAAIWLGLAGTVTSFAARDLGLTSYDPSKTHGHQLTRDRVQDITREFLAVTTRDRQRLLLEPKRAEVIVGGALILDAIFDSFRLSCVRVSERDILDGLAASALELPD